MKPRMVRPLFSGHDKSNQVKKQESGRLPNHIYFDPYLICDVILSIHTSKKKETLFRSYHFILFQPLCNLYKPSHMFNKLDCV
jgi:hypothetical protein